MTTARILIADDHPLIRSGMKALLESRPGWKVCAEADNGQQAVSKAAELKPDAVILDLAMPGMDGLRAAREILKLLPKVPILIHTVYKCPELERQAQKAGVCQVVSKSENAKRLQTAVAVLLRRKNLDQPTT